MTRTKILHLHRNLNSADLLVHGQEGKGISLCKRLTKTVVSANTYDLYCLQAVSALTLAASTWIDMHCDIVPLTV